MIGYVLKNSNGEYLSMDGGITEDWFKASKFGEEGIMSRKVYFKCGYELFSFKIKEDNVVTCTNKCYSKIKINIDYDGIKGKCTDYDGIKGKCTDCDDLVYHYSS